MGRETRFDVDGGSGGSLDADGRSHRNTKGAKDMTTTRKDADDKQRFDQAVNERAEVISQARTVLPENFKFDLLSVRQIREAALKEMNVTLDVSSKGDDYVHGLFEQTLSNLEKQRGADAASSPRADSGGRRSTLSDAREARARLDARERRLGTPACQQPLAYTKDARGNEKLESWERPLEVGQTNTGKTYGLDDDGLRMGGRDPDDGSLV